MSYQLTIQRPVQTSGVGLHTAVRSKLRLVPAPADTGIVFRRVDLDNFEIVTKCGPLTLTGQVQEFIVPTPEPGTLALLICGMLAVCAGLMRRGQLTT